MRKLFTLIVISIALSTAMPMFAIVPNLLNGWDGSGATGTLSKPNDVGWLNTVTASIPWTVANGSGGCRFRDSGVSGGYTAGSFTYESGGAALTTRQLMFRWDATAYSSSIYAFPVTLEACTTYTFSMDYVCGGSATPPQNITVGVSTTANSTGRLSSKVLTTTTSAVIFRSGTYTFTTGVTAGTYYMTFNGAYAWFGIANLNLVKSTDQSLATSKAYMFFDNSSDGLTKTFIVQGGALTSPVTLTSPSGITLSSYSISAADAQCGVTVTASFNNSKSISNDTIYMTSGTLTKKIVIDAIKNNLIGSWDGNGDTVTVVTPSLPTKYGWACSTVNWAAANLSTVGTCRYFDSPANYTYNGFPYLGRVLYARWDGNNTAGVDGVFTYPMTLQSGKSYQFGGKFAYNSNGSAPVLRVGVYATADTTGTAYSIQSIQTGAALNLLSNAKVFTVPTDGTYYLTFKANTLSLNGLADLYLRDVTGIVSGVNQQKMSKVSVYAQNKHIAATVNMLATDEVEMTVFNVQGVRLYSSRSVLTAGVNRIQTSAMLPGGIYVVRLLQKGQVLTTAKVIL
jgi:hypothetical protein